MENKSRGCIWDLQGYYNKTPKFKRISKFYKISFSTNVSQAIKLLPTNKIKKSRYFRKFQLKEKLYTVSMKKKH